jgi:hypothetical protein
MNETGAPARYQRLDVDMLQSDALIRKASKKYRDGK